MKIFNKKLLTPEERKNLQKLDNMILNASTEKLKEIQEIDYQTQLEGLSFYDVYVDSNSLIHHNAKNRFEKY
jgi:hypothetical protein